MQQLSDTLEIIADKYIIIEWKYLTYDFLRGGKSSPDSLSMLNSFLILSKLPLKLFDFIFQSNEGK